MFLCTACHSQTCTRCQPHLSGSYGPCEGCGYTRACADCHCRCEVQKPKSKTKKG